jgi:arylsulfatase A-like enzyme
MPSEPISRREFLQVVGAGTASLLLPSIGLGADENGAKPNVLFIAVDDLNDWIGCLGGHPDTKTPNLDRLAKRGVLFSNAHCAAPLCNPSRAALMTGVRPSTSGIYRNPQPWREGHLAAAPTIPQHFRASGYRAIGGGKIFHGRFPDPPSWSHYFPDKKRTKPRDPMPPNRPLNGIPRAAHFDWGPVDVENDKMGDWQVANWARRELQTQHDKPFFLACGLFRPHLPWYVPPQYFKMFPADKVTLPKVNKDDLSDVPPAGRRVALNNEDHVNVLKTSNWHKAVAGYLASVAFADACVGRVLDALDNGPNAKDTIIVLWGDHGWHLGEKLHWRKFTLWEEATRCPLMIVAPGVGKPGVCTRPVSLMDIYPTLVDLCGLGKNNRLEGNSLVPLLRNPSAKWEQPALTTNGYRCDSLRSERWRYIRYADGSDELYDHGNDALEWTNLAGKPEHAEAKAELARWLPKVNRKEPRSRRRR